MTARLGRKPCVAASLPILFVFASLGVAGPPQPLDRLSFLLGEWRAGANTGVPGTGAGGCAFTLALQGRVMTRTNHAEYPASATAPAITHDDLMIIYPGEAGLEAHYYDNEGHVIHYAVTTAGQGEALFVSDVVAGQPRFKLRYTLRPDGTLDAEFAIAPPGKPEAFARYLSWESQRATGK